MSLRDKVPCGSMGCDGSFFSATAVGIAPRYARWVYGSPRALHWVDCDLGDCGHRMICDGMVWHIWRSYKQTDLPSFPYERCKVVLARFCRNMMEYVGFYLRLKRGGTVILIVNSLSSIVGKQDHHVRNAVKHWKTRLKGGRGFFAYVLVTY